MLQTRVRVIQAKKNPSRLNNNRIGKMIKKLTLKHICFRILNNSPPYAMGKKLTYVSIFPLL